MDRRRQVSEPAGNRFANNEPWVHIAYAQRRQVIQHVIVDPSKLSLRPIVDGVWPD